MCQKLPLVFCDRNHPQYGPKVNKILPKTTTSFLNGLFCYAVKHFVRPRQKISLQITIKKNVYKWLLNIGPQVDSLRNFWLYIYLVGVILELPTKESTASVFIVVLNRKLCWYMVFMDSSLYLSIQYFDRYFDEFTFL